ncbi:MAG TPA: AmmeMemoRadiSam system protein B [Candidatus Hypogeohydataceae bacterium YC41]
MSISEKLVFFPHQLLEVLRFFDGRHTLRDIQNEFARRHGVTLFIEQLEEILQKLDEHIFLEGERFNQFVKDLQNEFHNSSLRRAFLAGRSYEGDPGALSKQLEGFFLAEEGPNSLPGRQERDELKGAIIPHIDFGRGGPYFAWAYKEIAESSSARSFILLGTAHHPMQGAFALTKKDFETPFGILKTEQPFVEALIKKTGSRFLNGEFAHRAEHSIELQAVFIQYLFGGRQDVSIIPILCSSFQEALLKGSSPTDITEIKDFLEILKETISTYRNNVSVIASADLSHMGPRFGDPFYIDSQQLDAIAQEDTATIRLIEAMDAEGFFASVQKDGDKRKICGLAPIYTLLKVIQATEGRLIKYGQWPDPVGTVSFASISFY